MLRQSLMVLMAALAVGCGKKNGTQDSALEGGGARKVNLAKGSGLLPAGTLKDLELSGGQVNVNIQSVKDGSTYLTYVCDIGQFTSTPTLQSFSTRLGIDFKDASQVNCAMAAPDGARIVVTDAGQANINLIGAGTSLELTTSAQANVTLALRAGSQYSFSVSGVQVNGLVTCNPYRTTSAAAPSVVINAGAQANITCIDIDLANWVLPALSDPDGIVAKALNGSLL